jgi:hypothetical protein
MLAEASSRKVNSVESDDEECIEPIGDCRFGPAS